MIDRGAPAILIVDGSWQAKASTAVLVSDAGCVPLLANTTEEAVGQLESVQDIKLVITEIELPGTLDGVGLVDLIRERWPQIQVVVVTANDNPDRLGLPADVRVFRKSLSYLELATFVQAEFHEADGDD